MEPRLFKPRVWGDQEWHAGGTMPYERREYTVHFDSGEPQKEAYNAFERTPGGTYRRREIRRFEADGVQFTADGVDLQEEYEGGRCVAVTLDGVRYVRERTCTLTMTYAGDPCSDWTCSECGKVHVEHNRAPVDEHCPRCGARRTGVVMDPWNPAKAAPEEHDG